MKNEKKKERKKEKKMKCRLKAFIHDALPPCVIRSIELTCLGLSNSQQTLTICEATNISVPVVPLVTLKAQRGISHHLTGRVA